MYFKFCKYLQYIVNTQNIVNLLVLRVTLHWSDFGRVDVDANEIGFLQKIVESKQHLYIL